MRFLRLYVPEFYRSVRFAVACLADRLRTVLKRIDTGGEKIARRMTAIGLIARRGPKKTRRGPKVQRGPNFKFNFGPRSALDHA